MTAVASKDLDFKVSVIIPVYNAADYIAKAITSASTQAEVAEVIVVNDGSTDATTSIIEAMAQEDPKIRVLYHPSRENRGRAASRNLGIKNATSTYIAFLDADDYYLENRFENDKAVFANNTNCDGVYNAIGVHFYREFDTDEKEKLALTTLQTVPHPKELFLTLLRGQSGSFSIDGLTVKKNALQEAGFFNEDLVVMEDTELIWKLALLSQLYPGLLSTPVAMRGVHSHNVFDNQSIYEQQELKFYESLFFWSTRKGMATPITERFLERIWLVKFNKKQSLFVQCLYWTRLVIRTPQLLGTSLHYKYNPLQRVKRFLKLK